MDEKSVLQRFQSARPQKKRNGIIKQNPENDPCGYAIGEKSGERGILQNHPQWVFYFRGKIFLN